MSNLSNLFSMGMGGGGGGSLDNGDALKYLAPKEPKRKVSIKIEAEAKVSPAPVTTTQKPVPPTVPQAAKPLGPSKVMASAAVRLYKINQGTRAYEPVENGSMLGCAILGTGLNFQILVYNAQKVPQAAVLIASAFDYTVREYYVSFADSSGNFWSLLFDNLDSMTNVLKVISAIICHLNTHNESATESLRRLLPRNPDVQVDETVLTSGMTAGIYIDVFEIGEQADYPGDVVQMPLKRVSNPADVLKVKVGSSDLIAGLGEALVGLTKGDRCMIGISPRLFYQSTSNEWVSMSERNHPTNWIVLQVEVVKIKSSDSAKEKKKEKKLKEEENVTLVPSPAEPVAAITVTATPAEATTPDIKSRMARMAAASGAPQQLGDFLGGRKVASDSHLAEVAVAAEPVEHAVTAAVTVAAQSVAVSTPLAQPQQKSQAASVTTAPVSTVILSPSPSSLTPVAIPAVYRPQDSILAQKEAMLQQSQDTLNQQLVSSGASPAYAVAVTAESSLMVSETSGMRDRNALMMMELSQQSQQQYFTQFQQSMMIIQQSMMQMHTKLDQVGMSVNNTFSLVQQQASAVTMNSANGGNGAGMANMNGMGMGGMNGMGMLNFGGVGMGGMGGMNPMAMGNMGGMNPMMMSYGGNMNSGYYNNNFVSNPIRGKVEDLVSTAQFLLQQYDQLKRENDELQNRGSSQQEIQSLYSQIQQLTTYVTELEGQRSQWQREKDDLNVIIDTLKTEKIKLENDLTIANTSGPPLESEIVQSYLGSKLKEHESSFNLQIKSLETDLEQQRLSSSSKISALENEVAELQQSLSDMRIQAEKDLAEAKAVVAEPTSSSVADEKLKDLEQEIVSLRAQLQMPQEEINMAQALAKEYNIAAPNECDNSSKILELQQQVEQLQAAVTTGGKFSEDDIKSCIQNVFLQASAAFITSEELASVDDETKRETMAQVTKLNIKRLKEVLRQISVNILG